MTVENAVRALNQVFNDHDVEKAVAQAADDVQFENVPWGLTFDGKDGLRQALSGWIEAFPDVKVDIKNLVVSDSAAAYEYDFIGTNTGPLVGPRGQASPTGRSVSVKGCAFLKFRDGKLTNLNVYFDPTVGSVIGLDLIYA
jgi:steroid delta-isomerase-like uncharacterized protein